MPCATPPPALPPPVPHTAPRTACHAARLRSRPPVPHTACRASRDAFVMPASASTAAAGSVAFEAKGHAVVVGQGKVLQNEREEFAGGGRKQMEGSAGEAEGLFGRAAAQFDEADLLMRHDGGGAFCERGGILCGGVGTSARGFARRCPVRCVAKGMRRAARLGRRLCCRRANCAVLRGRAFT